MLLRRVIEHVQNQNWTAVTIDFFIVVVGVFVGLQVQEWYEERARRVADSQYMERLHGEVVELLSIRENVVVPRSENYANLKRATQKLYGTGADVTLTTSECAAIQLSHVFINPTIALPTADELLATGRLDTLSSPIVKSAIIGFRQTVARADDVIESINAGILILTRKYPLLIKLDGSINEDYGLIIESPKPSCDVAGMRSDQGFLNDLADNANRFEAYHRFTLSEPTKRLTELRSALETEL